MAKKINKRMKLSDQVRKAVDDAGVSRNQICKDIGTDKATLSRFMSAERGLTITVLDALAEYLGLEVVKTGKSKSKGEKP